MATAGGGRIVITRKEADDIGLRTVTRDDGTKITQGALCRDPAGQAIYPTPKRAGETFTEMLDRNAEDRRRMDVCRRSRSRSQMER